MKNWGPWVERGRGGWGIGLGWVGLKKQVVWRDILGGSKSITGAVVGVGVGRRVAYCTCIFISYRDINVLAAP